MTAGDVGNASSRAAAHPRLNSPVFDTDPKLDYMSSGDDPTMILLPRAAGGTGGNGPVSPHNTDAGSLIPSERASPYNMA